MVWGFIEEMYLIIGDIHGCVKTLNRLLDEAVKKYVIEEIFILGDLIDRGRYSQEVLKVVSEVKSNIPTIIFLGNHEDMFLDFVLDTKRYEPEIWLYNGGKTTLESFNANIMSNDENYFRDFCRENILGRFASIFDSLKIFKELSLGNKKYLLSHAGGFYGDKLPEELYNALNVMDKTTFFPFIWDREADFRTERYHDFSIIHGHNPTKKISFQNPDTPYINGDISINIDTGCVYGYSLSSVFINSEGDFEFLSARCID